MAPPERAKPKLFGIHFILVKEPSQADVNEFIAGRLPERLVTPSIVSYAVHPHLQSGRSAAMNKVGRFLYKHMVDESGTKAKPWKSEADLQTYTVISSETLKKFPWLRNKNRDLEYHCMKVLMQMIKKSIVANAENEQEKGPLPQLRAKPQEGNSIANLEEDYAQAGSGSPSGLKLQEQNHHSGTNLATNMNQLQIPPAKHIPAQAPMAVMVPPNNSRGPLAKIQSAETVKAHSPNDSIEQGTTSTQHALATSRPSGVEHLGLEDQSWINIQSRSVLSLRIRQVSELHSDDPDPQYASREDEEHIPKRSRVDMPQTPNAYRQQINVTVQGNATVMFCNHYHASAKQ